MRRQECQDSDRQELCLLGIVEAAGLLTPNAFRVAGTSGQHHSSQGTLQNHLRKP